MKPIFARNKVDFIHKLDEFNKAVNFQSIIILMAENSDCMDEEIQHAIKNSSKTILGGVFPQIIFESELKDTGVVLIPVENKIDVYEFDLNYSIIECYETMCGHIPGYSEENKTLYVFLDARGKRKDEFIECLFNYFGISVKYLGGACGSKSFRSIPCVISNKGINSNVALFGISQRSVSFAIANGWKSISSTLKITEAVDNTVVTINLKPAYPVYKNVIREITGRKDIDKEFFRTYKSNPFGILKIDGDYTIREVVDVNDDVLICSDRINSGEYVSVMQATKEDLWNAAREAMEMARSPFEDFKTEDYCTFCINCVARALYLGDDFNQELNIIGSGTKVFGMLSLGEIANRGDHFLDIYNNTVAIAVWKKNI
ncbi:MAG: FIST C-terminal domain-containing protein [Paludibacter sp.]|nr:FIST C-terminal domain-containing protein [Paludibacter sp.]